MRAFNRSLLFPALVVVVILALEYWRKLDGVPADVFLLAARSSFALAFLLAWRFRRGRSAWATVLLALYGESLQGSFSGSAAPSSLAAAKWILPLALTINAWSPDFPILSRQGAKRWLTLGALAAILSPPLWSQILAWFQSTGWQTPSPQTTYGAVLGIAAIALGIRLWTRPSPLEAGWIGTLAALCLSFGADRNAMLWLAAAGLILNQALVEGAFMLAFQDGLTGLPGRRALDERLSQLGGTYTIAMVDLDHFKKLNDRYGHEVGDQVLRWVARELEAVGGGGIAYRYGGEEFTVLFPGRNLEKAKPHLETLRQRIAAEPFTLRGSDRPKTRPKKASSAKKKKAQSVRVTASFGVAERGPRRPPHQVLKAADKALYRAKRAGRNRLAVTRS